MKKILLKIEKMMPIFLSISIFLCLNKVLPSKVTVPNLEFILNSLITCGATFSGFTLTVVSILMSLASASIMKRLIEKGGEKELRCRYIFSMALGIVLVIVCIFIGGTVGENNELSKNIAILLAVVAIVYLYSLLSSGAYLLWTISLASNPPLRQDDNQSCIPPGENRVD